MARAVLRGDVEKPGGFSVWILGLIPGIQEEEQWLCRAVLVLQEQWHPHPQKLIFFKAFSWGVSHLVKSGDAFHSNLWNTFLPISGSAEMFLVRKIFGLNWCRSVFRTMSRKFARLLYRPHLLALPTWSSNSENSEVFFSPGHFVHGSSGFVEEGDISLMHFIS